MGDAARLVGEAGGCGRTDIDLDSGGDLTRGIGGTVAGTAFEVPFEVAVLAPGRIWEYEDRRVDGRPGEEDSAVLDETCRRWALPLEVGDGGDGELALEAGLGTGTGGTGGTGERGGAEAPGLPADREGGLDGGRLVLGTRGEVCRCGSGVLVGGGETARRAGGLVTACLKVGGAVAIALALARLAAIAAATLGFFLTSSTGVIGVQAPGFGLAFSSCFLAEASSCSASTKAFAGQTGSKVQKHVRATGRTPGLGSESVLWRDLVIMSTPPLLSIACFDLAAWVLRYVEICSSIYVRD